MDDRGKGPAWRSSCTTPMQSANGPTTARPRIGRLDKALDEAQARGWTVVNMKHDWKRIFPFEAK